MAARTGKEFLEGLRDGRHVSVDGEVVDDVTTHPRTAGGARALADLYDLQHRAETSAVTTFPSPLSGEPVARSYALARSQQELIERGHAFDAVARATGGLMGRSPDFLATVLTSWAAAADFFGRADPRFAANLRAYHEYAREGDRCHSHAISDPPRDRHVPAGEAPGPPLVLREVGETREGIVVSGAKMLATLAPFCDELLIYPFRPLAPGDDDQALMFAIPAATPGLRLLCRDGLGGHGGRFDHPLAERFDEMDAICVFDEVVVPWDRVFMRGSAAQANALRRETGMTSYAWHQAGVRAAVKAELVFGIASLLADAGGKAASPVIQDKLGELAAYVETVWAIVVAAERTATQDAFGWYVASAQTLGALGAVNSTLYPRAIELLQLIGSSGLIMHPTEKDLEGSSADYFEDYFRGRTVSGREHAELLKLAADLAVHGFGGRQVLYERFYLGQPEAFRATYYKGYDARRAQELARALCVPSSPAVSA
jgi:4-hydroxyphenylacetate 3-monooxygenase oxygenase component